MTLLGVAVPENLGRQTEGYEATGGSSATLAILLQVYDDPLNQKAIAEICALYAGAGLRLIGVESADRPIAPVPRQTDIARLLATEQVSAGVLSLLNGGLAGVDVHGVDDLSLIPPSHRAMEVISAARAHRDTVFQAVRQILQQAMIRSGHPEVAAARAARFEVYGARKPLAIQAGLARDAARATGVNVAGFPLVMRFLEMAEREKRLDTGRATREREAFLRRVVERIGGWHRSAGGNRININLKKAMPLLEYWLEETRQSAASFEASLKGPNPEGPFLACKQWYDAWLGAEAADAARPEFWERLMRFALRVGIPYFELRAFREWVANSRDSERLKIGLDDEIEDLHRTIADTLRGPAADLVAVEARLDTIHRLLQLAVPPGHAAAEAARAGPVGEAVHEMARLAGASLSPEVKHALDALEAPARAALEFLEYSRRRSAHMVERVLELLEARHEDRAALVVGGFHAKAITTALEDHPDVSWGVIMPAVDVEAGWRAHRQRF